MTRGPARTWPRRALDCLASGRLAVVILCLLVAVSLVCIFVPQWSEGEAADRAAWMHRYGRVAGAIHAIGLTGLRRSPFTWGLCATLAVNLSLCMIRRVPAVLAAARLPRRPPAPAAWPATRMVETGASGIEAAHLLLRRRGYATTMAEGVVFGLRGRYALAGHWVFHLGLMVLLAAALLAAAAGAPFRAGVVIGEGESFDLHASTLIGSTVPITEAIPAIAFDLESIAAATEDYVVRGFEARLRTPDGDLVTMGVNRPYRVAPYQVLIQGFGYMPGWVVVDEEGRMIRGAWLKMAPFPYGGEEVIRIGPRTSDVRVAFYPDHAREEGEDRSLTYDLRNPRFRATVRLRGETIHDGLLDPGQRVPLGEGRSFLFLPEIRMYGIFDVVGDEGHATLFAGFGIAAIGLCLRYGRIRKEILVEVRPIGLRVSGRSEMLESLFEEEMDRFAADLGRHAVARRPRGSDS